MKKLAAVIWAIAVSASAQSGTQQQIQLLQQQFPAIDALKNSNPARYVAESLRWVDQYEHALAKYPELQKNPGLATPVTGVYMRLGDFARLRQREPKQAIDYYRRGGLALQRLIPSVGPTSLNEQIADVYEFDLHDYPSSAAALKPLYVGEAKLPRIDRPDYAAWARWRQRWYQAEIAFLEHGTHFNGSVTFDDIGGIEQQLFFVGGMLANEQLLDPSLNPQSDKWLAPADYEKKVMALPPSHSMFMRTYLFATRMGNVASFRTWLDRNDPAGFWKASFLAYAAAADRAMSANARDTRLQFATMLLRNRSGQPSVLTIVAREYAKTHAIPSTPRPQR